MFTLKSLIYDPSPPYDNGDESACPTLQVLDQLLLPETTAYVAVPNLLTTWSVIRTMQVRGKIVATAPKLLFASSQIKSPWIFPVTGHHSDRSTPGQCLGFRALKIYLTNAVPVRRTKTPSSCAL
jgi:hypothetical protein